MTDDELRLEHGVRRLLRRWYDRGPLYRILMGSVGLVTLLNVVFVFPRIPAVGIGVVLLIGGLFALSHVIIRLAAYTAGQTRASVIPLGSITRVGYYEGGTFAPPGLVVYYDVDGEETGRSFTLPSTRNGAEAEFEKAKSIFSDRGIRLTETEVSPSEG
ncbi:hypothetical protein [Halococcus sp. IIIV-5B]|uniref:hypothetical protein n=1 Tax=Halococcus sp. IIIV-5B TaxID=2321230 RepID=UPI0011C4129A|nr:hypothetical protein [Halococcus sp. IIIV-5B]